MIKSFSHKGLEDFFYDGTLKRIQPKHAPKLAAILDKLDAAHQVKDVNFPGGNLHKLEPKQADIWSVKVSANWRVTFRFEDGDVYEVNYLDYH